MRLSGVVRCHVEANPPFQFITWTKDKRIFDPFETPNVGVLKNGSLLFEKVINQCSWFLIVVKTKSIFLNTSNMLLFQVTASSKNIFFAQFAYIDYSIILTILYTVFVVAFFRFHRKTKAVILVRRITFTVLLVPQL